ncbi:FAD-binding oxidoreductase [Persicobacter sp. CCB-QB2]|uniref:FAD-binding oxidoreductase n=1 Tax=Persicobacter sp. CCB-QB2 TaxID=1561025 RepID=UPI0006A9D929|nr:FAD-binding oxidoreductase [Persicobacter sp. CCB-QB2]
MESLIKNEEFIQSIRGTCLFSGDLEYEQERALYNAMIDKHPAMIVKCEDVADVITTVNYAREEGLLLAVRCGGHNGAGFGSCDGGVLLDLKHLDGRWIDPETGIVKVEGGCTWGDVDHLCHAFGRAVPSGIISTTGVGGLTLGGGHGYLTRKFGLTIDNLVEAEVVLANGELVVANENKNADLFWAIRGGGGNFGVVTSFTFQSREVKEIYGGVSFFELERSAEILDWYLPMIENAEEDLYGFYAFLRVPPAPPFPEHLHTKNLCGIVWCYTGNLQRGEQRLHELMHESNPVFTHLGAMPFPAIQTMFDALYPKGHQWYWRGDFFTEITPQAREEFVKWGSQVPTIHSTMHIYPINGAVQHKKPQDTAFSHREAKYSVVYVGVDPDPANKDLITDWCKNYHEACHPYSSGGAYLNFMMEEGEDRIRSTYRANYDKLVEVKRKYDPQNLFRVNQNIKP